MHEFITRDYRYCLDSLSICLFRLCLLSIIFSFRQSLQGTVDFSGTESSLNYHGHCLQASMIDSWAEVDFVINKRSSELNLSISNPSSNIFRHRPTHLLPHKRSLSYVADLYYLLNFSNSCNGSYLNLDELSSTNIGFATLQNRNRWTIKVNRIFRTVKRTELYSFVVPPYGDTLYSYLGGYQACCDSEVWKKQDYPRSDYFGVGGIINNDCQFNTKECRGKWYCRNYVDMYYYPSRTNEWVVENVIADRIHQLEIHILNHDTNLSDILNISVETLEHSGINMKMTDSYFQKNFNNTYFYRRNYYTGVRDSNIYYFNSSFLNLPNRFECDKYGNYRLLRYGFISNLMEDPSICYNITDPSSPGGCSSWEQYKSPIIKRKKVWDTLENYIFDNKISHVTYFEIDPSMNIVAYNTSDGYALTMELSIRNQLIKETFGRASVINYNITGSSLIVDIFHEDSETRKFIIVMNDDNQIVFSTIVPKPESLWDAVEIPLKFLFQPLLLKKRFISGIIEGFVVCTSPPLSNCPSLLIGFDGESYQIIQTSLSEPTSCLNSPLGINWGCYTYEILILLDVLAIVINIIFWPIFIMCVVGCAITGNGTDLFFVTCLRCCIDKETYYEKSLKFMNNNQRASEAKEEALSLTNQDEEWKGEQVVKNLMTTARPSNSGSDLNVEVTPLESDEKRWAPTFINPARAKKIRLFFGDTESDKDD